jgi:chromosome segregation ATPase
METPEQIAERIVTGHLGGSSVPRTLLYGLRGTITGAIAAERARAETNHTAWQVAQAEANDYYARVRELDAELAIVHGDHRRVAVMLTKAEQEGAVLLAELDEQRSENAAFRSEAADLARRLQEAQEREGRLIKACDEWRQRAGVLLSDFTEAQEEWTAQTDRKEAEWLRDVDFLRSALQAYRAALEPFAWFAQVYDKKRPLQPYEDEDAVYIFNDFVISVGDIRRARDVLAE